MARVKQNSFIAILFFGIVFSSYAQFYRSKNFGCTIGAVISLGNRFQRIGINFNACYFYNFAQINLGVRSYRSLKNLGPSLEYNETVLSGGLVLAAGKRQSFYNPFISSYSNQTKRKFSLGYSYNVYLNKIKTKQQTGIIALQFDQFTIVTENDILAKPVLDRFRTGAFLLQYQYKDIYQVGINCTMWTGQMGNACRNDSAFKFGYMDSIGGIYPNLSHGLLSAQLKVNIGYTQNIQCNVGVDAEQVRNVVQNKIIHDMPFVPKRLNKANNCHIPMIDSKGVQFLYKPDQKVRTPQFYWNVGSNPSAFY